jgi:hypothetical protein
MRTRELVMLVALLGACIDNPDPRHPSLERTERQGYGAFITITTLAGQEVSGELISVERSVIRVLRFGAGTGALTWVASTDVKAATVYQYESEGGFGGWALLGVLSTISHGFFLIISAPVWIISGAVAGGTESRHVVMEYPEHAWGEIVKWARFPQGLPPGLDEEALTTPKQRRTKPGPAIVQPPAPPPPTNDQMQTEARRQAWELTKQAQAAARANDCGSVLTISGKVQTTDADFYDTIFIKDAAIRRCLGL